VLDDDLIDDRPRAPSARSANRGFWIVAAATGTVVVIVMTALFANRPLRSQIGRAQEVLRDAADAADRLSADGGTYWAATSDRLPSDGDVRYVPGDVASTGLDVVSVFASHDVWAASVEARPGACFHIKRVVGGDTTYGSGTVCTGEAALAAEQGSW
jgi:hypothetical protein